MTAEQRTEMRSLPDDLTVTLTPDYHWTSGNVRVWLCRISRGDVTLAEAGHGELMGAFRLAVVMLAPAAV
jgi:hypothetical protein